MNILGIVIGVILICAAVLFGMWAGVKLGSSLTTQRFKEIAKQPIAGQTVNVRGIGDVFILGRGHDDVNGDGVISDEEEYIDYISQDILNGRTPADLDDDELDTHTVSVPLHQFVLQCDFVRAQAFKE